MAPGALNRHAWRPFAHGLRASVQPTYRDRLSTKAKRHLMIKVTFGSDRPYGFGSPWSIGSTETIALSAWRNAFRGGSLTTVTRARCPRSAPKARLISRNSSGVVGRVGWSRLVMVPTASAYQRVRHQCKHVEKCFNPDIAISRCLHHSNHPTQAVADQSKHGLNFTTPTETAALLTLQCQGSTTPSSLTAPVRCTSLSPPCCSEHSDGNRSVGIASASPLRRQNRGVGLFHYHWGTTRFGVPTQPVARLYCRCHARPKTESQQRSPRRRSGVSWRKWERSCASTLRRSGVRRVQC